MANFVFIVSQPRSGSTLLQSLVSNSEYVNTASEPWLLLPFLSYARPDVQLATYNSSLAKEGINEFVETYCDDEFFKGSLKAFFERVYSVLANENVKYILDKTPRYYEILPLITEFFPDAKIIVLKRNPLSVLLSIMDSWNVRTFPELSFYERDILNAPFLIQDFIEQNRGNPNVLECFYEKLTMDPAEEVQRIYKWLEIPYSPSILDYLTNKKMQGAMGDKVGFILHDKIVKGKPVEIEQLDSFWKNFSRGYLAYLKPDFLQRYGDYRYNFEFYPTKAFNQFLFLNRVQYFKNKELNFINLIKLFAYKINTLFNSKYKY